MAASTFAGMEVTTLLMMGAVALVTALVVAAAMFFAISRFVGQSIAAVATTGGKVIDRTADTVSHVVDKGAEVLAPVSRGVEDILNSVADRIRLKQNDLNDLTAKSIALAQEVERLKGRHIDVTKITAQLRLGLIEVKQQYHSYRKQTIANANETLVSGGSTTEYVGLHRAKYSSQVGLDIDRLQFALTEEGVVLVHGLREVQILGMKELKCEELLDEVRHFTGKTAVRSRSAEILLNDERLQEHISEHRATLLEEIQSSQSVQHLAGATAEFGLAFLQACLGTGGFRVMESLQPLANSLTFVNLCHQINQRVNQLMEDAKNRQTGIGAEVKAIQIEMIKIPAEQAHAALG